MNQQIKDIIARGRRQANERLSLIKSARALGWKLLRGDYNNSDRLARQLADLTEKQAELIEELLRANQAYRNGIVKFALCAKGDSTALKEASKELDIVENKARDMGYGGE